MCVFCGLIPARMRISCAFSLSSPPSFGARPVHATVADLPEGNMQPICVCVCGRCIARSHLERTLTRPRFPAVTRSIGTRRRRRRTSSFAASGENQQPRIGFDGLNGAYGRVGERSSPMLAGASSSTHDRGAADSVQFLSFLEDQSARGCVCVFVCLCVQVRVSQTRVTS